VSHGLAFRQGNIPTFIHISDGKLRDVNILVLLIPEPDAFYITVARNLSRGITGHDAGDPSENTGPA